MVPAAAPAAGTASAGPGVAMTPAAVAFLQRTAGNAAVDALMRRTWYGAPETDQEHYADAIEEKREYVDEGVRGPEDFRSSTGIGGFNVAYDPAGGELAIVLRGAVDFLHGMELQGGRAVALQPHPNAQAAADNINAMAADLRPAAVAGWRWGDDARAAFLTRFESVVRGVWSGQHEFHCSKRYWEDIAGLPDVSAEVHEGEKTDEDHVAMSVYKVPPNFVGNVGVVNPGSGGFLGLGAARDNTMTLNSVDVEHRTDDVLHASTQFTPGERTIDPGATDALNAFAIRFRSGGPLCSMCGNAIESVAGVAITATVEGAGTGEEAERSALDRFRALTTALVAGGMTDAMTRLLYAYGGEGDEAHLEVGNGVPQIIAAHEAGHMFGLGDRYATTAGSGVTGTGPSVGLPSRHDELAREGGLGDAKAANDDGIMSFGNEVRPADYATFLEALKEVSGMDEWALGSPGIVVPPGSGGEGSAPGDYPLPPRDPSSAVA